MEQLLAMLAGFLLVILGIILVFYILGSLGLMGIANKTETKGGWMAWLPIFNFYLMGKLAFGKAMGWVLVVLSFLGGTSTLEIGGETVFSGSILPAPFNTIASIALLVLMIASLYKIYTRMSDKAVVMTVFTVLSLGLLTPIFLFAIRKNNVIA